MSLYKVRFIKDKGLGCIATEDIKPGTLIERETPIISVQGEPFSSSKFLEDLWTAFFEMDVEDREEFLTLHDGFANGSFDPFLTPMIPQDFKGDVDLLIKIARIYKTNGFSSGVQIKTARFNHSCQSNAESSLISNVSEIRSVTKIRKGEEICINYHWLKMSMKPLNERQCFLLNTWAFECECNLCVEECKNKNIHGGEIYVRFEVLRQVFKDIGKEFNLNSVRAEFKQIGCLKDLYRMAKEKKASRNFIIQIILEEGIKLSVQGYLKSKSLKLLEECKLFENECRIFVRASLKIGKILYGDASPMFKELSDDFEDWLKSNLKTFNEFFAQKNIDYLRL